MENTKEKKNGIMRLYNIFYICKACLPAIRGLYVIEPKDPNVVIVKRWRDCRVAMDSLRGIECFEDAISDIYDMVDWQLDRLEVRLPAHQKTDFEKMMSSFSASVETLVNLCDMMEMGEASSGIDVKIPKCSSLKEYMAYLKEIDFIFTQCPFLLHKEEEIKFGNVDVGSQWLAFAVIGGSGALYILNALAKLISKAVEVKSNILVCRQQEEVLEEMRQKNEVGRETIDAFKKLKQITMDRCVADLEADIRELSDNEERDKVKWAIESLVLLMDKGVEIYSSIETPKEVKVLFPFQKDTVVLPDNILKLLEDKKEE